MRRIRLTATLTAALLLLAGCGAQQGANEGNQQHKEPEQAQQQPEPETSERGNLVKHIGDTAYIYADTSKKTEWARWTVTNITLDAPCTNEYAEPSENGHMVVMDVTAQTTKDLPTDQPLYLGAPGAWQYVLKDGTISNAPVQGCRVNDVPPAGRYAAGHNRNRQQGPRKACVRPSNHGRVSGL